jgi:hypothetical protein
MIPEPPTDAEAFYGFLGEQLAAGGRDLPPEELLHTWRTKKDPEYAATVKAVREALADMANGDTGKPWEQVFRELRERHNLPASQ